MSIIQLLKDALARVIGHVTWQHILLVVCSHAFISWILLALAGEQNLIRPEVFGYWYITTTTTVGYGDLAPQTTFGRYVTGLWVMLGGIAIITSVIGKLTGTLIDIWRKKVKGMNDLEHFKNHTVIVGWHGIETMRIIDLLNEDSHDHKIVLLSSCLDESPFDNPNLYFVKCESQVSESALISSGVKQAKRILVYGHDDEDTLAIVLAANNLTEKAHIVAHFLKSSIADLAKKYAPKVECTSGLALEMLVHAACDPGSSDLIRELLSIADGPTQFSSRIGERVQVRYIDALQTLKARYNATLIGYKHENGQQVINANSEDMLTENTEIYYISNQRLTQEEVNNGIS
ncbi:MAG: ion channel [Hafnia sp.]